MANGKTFVKISNQQVYNELCDLKTNNEKDHDEIKTMIEGYNRQMEEYKSQIGRLYWAIGGLGTLTMAILIFLINHLGGKT